MNAQEKQLIDLLFSKLQETGSKSGPRDAQAESHINQLMAQIPGAGYYMTQAIIVQQQALKHAEAKIAQLEEKKAAVVKVSCRHNQLGLRKEVNLANPQHNLRVVDFWQARRKRPLALAVAFY